jgi:hypothetical protein
MCALSTASSPRSTGFSRRSAKRPPDRPTPGIAVSRRIRDHSRRDARRRRSRGTSLLDRWSTRRVSSRIPVDVTQRVARAPPYTVSLARSPRWRR